MAYSTAFVIGLIASFSTCMAVVGGLVLSMSATFAKDGDRVRPQIMFHIGRLASFFVFGGLIGAVGSAFTLSPAVAFALSFVTALVMLILGINLLDIFPWAEKMQIYMPEFVSRRANAVMSWNHTLTPLLVGIATFFLPCGFTQSMQFYTLGTGSFLAGGLTMLIFALGTLPALAVVSFSSLSIRDSAKAKIFFRVAGSIVIVFALFNLANSFAAFGIIRPIFGVSSITGSMGDSSGGSNVSIVNGRQIITIRARGGYQPAQSVAKAGIPTIIRFDTNGTFDCSSSVRIPSLGISKMLPQTGKIDIDIGTVPAGTLQGMCGMGMYPFQVDFQ